MANSSSSSSISISNIQIQNITHITDYISNIQTHLNPLDQHSYFRTLNGFYLTQTDIILRNNVLDLSDTFTSSTPPLAYLRAGPRNKIFFNPSDVKAAIVTCGGLCPGMNTVIGELVVGLWELYGVREIFGIKAGFRGFYAYDPVKLNPKMVDDWHKRGGTVLETSRGGFDLNKIVNAIQDHGFNQYGLRGLNIITRYNILDLSRRFPSSTPPLAYLRAAPRNKIFFNPSDVKAAIVTCGGCPGMGYGNCMVLERFLVLKRVMKMVDDWHKRGGIVLETSRGGFDLNKIVNAIQDNGFNQLYIIGGDGTLRGVVKIFEELKQRKLYISMVGIPKTVDNDVGIIDRSFGFQTAVEMAQQAINAAHVEAVSAVNGIGLVKLMGRSTGHIALHATLSSRDVDCCLIPEIDFYLEGKGGLFEFLEDRLKKTGHAVLVVAEGAGQDMIPRTESQKREEDESGNPVFLDVGGWLKSELKNWWNRDHPNELITIKYIDPTYMIRAVPANATDNAYCTLLAHSAIHGVMAGYTGFVCGPVGGNYAYIPVDEIAQAKNKVDTRDHKWSWVRSVSNQPDFIKS